VTDTTEADGFTLEDEPSTDAPAEGAEATKANDQNTAASKKDPLPEGWETPTAFAHRLTDQLEGYSKENPFKPQMVYGYVKNGKDFPQKNHTDGRFIVEIEPALAWIQVRVEKRAEREAAKAKAAEEAANATPAEEPVA
jgi:hypothetical protein